MDAKFHFQIYDMNMCRVNQSQTHILLHSASKYSEVVSVDL